jgi:hypothetical protein
MKRTTGHKWWGWLSAALAFCVAAPLTARAEDRDFHQINLDVKAFARRVSQAQSNADRASALVDLCLLHCEIVSHERFATSPTLQGYRGKVRLILNEFQKDAARATRAAERQTSRRQPRDNSAQESLADNALLTLLTDDHLWLSSQLQGGPAIVSQYAGPYFGGITQEDVDQLIELIESTIHPDTWAANGGAGSIHYWGPGLALVVRATTTVHEDLEEFLWMLRRSY